MDIKLDALQILILKFEMLRSTIEISLVLRLQYIPLVDPVFIYDTQRKKLRIIVVQYINAKNLAR